MSNDEQTAGSDDSTQELPGPLSFFSTEDLTNELMKRFDALVISGIQHLSNNSGDTGPGVDCEYLKTNGSKLTVLGILTFATTMVKHDILSSFIFEHPSSEMGEVDDDTEDIPPH